MSYIKSSKCLNPAKGIYCILILLLSAVLLHAQDAYLYWADYSDGTIYKLNIDGSDFVRETERASPNLSADYRINGMAVDSTTDILYRIERRASSINAYDTGLDTDTNIYGPPNVTKGGQLSLDAANGLAYFADTNSFNNSIEIGVMEAALDGSGITNLARGVVTALSVDTVGRMVYYSGRNSNNTTSIKCVEIDAPHTVTELTNLGGIHVNNVDIDSFNNKLFIAEEGGHLRRIALSGGPVEDFLPSHYNTGTVTVDDYMGKVYWVSTDNELMRANVNGTQVERLLTEATNNYTETLTISRNSPLPTGPVIKPSIADMSLPLNHDRFIYNLNIHENHPGDSEFNLNWSVSVADAGVLDASIDNDNGTLLLSPVSVGTTRVTLTLTDSASESISQDIDVNVTAALNNVNHLYWADYLNGTFRRLDLSDDSATPELVRASPDLNGDYRIKGITVDATTNKLYWSNWGDANFYVLDMNTSTEGLFLQPGILSAGGQMALDTTNGYSYISDANSFSDEERGLMKLSLDGSTWEAVIKGVTKAVVADLENRDLFFAQKATDGKISIYRLSMDDYSDIEHLRNIGNVMINSLDLDDVNQKLYLGIDQSPIYRMELDGSNYEALNPGERTTGAVVVDEFVGEVYWTNYDGELKRANLDGSRSEVVAYNFTENYTVNLSLVRMPALNTDPRPVIKPEIPSMTTPVNNTGFAYTLRKHENHPIDTETNQTWSVSVANRAILNARINNDNDNLVINPVSVGSTTITVSLTDSFSYTTSQDIPVTITAEHRGYNHLFWADYDDGTIKRLDIDDPLATPEVIRTSPDLNGNFKIRGMTVDILYDEIYWTDWSANSNLHRIYGDGSNETTLLQPESLLFAGKTDVDPTNRYMYVADSNSFNPNPYGLMRVNLFDNRTEVYVEGVTRDVALDLHTRYAYFIRKNSDSETAIWKVSMDESNVISQIRSLGGIRAEGLGLDTVNNKIYMADQSTGLYRMNFDGSSFEQFLPGETSNGDVSVDELGGQIYWMTNDNTQIKRANVDGTGVEVVISGFTNNYAIAMDVVRFVGPSIPFNGPPAITPTVTIPLLLAGGPVHVDDLSDNGVDPDGDPITWGLDLSGTDTGIANVALVAGDDLTVTPIAEGSTTFILTLTDGTSPPVTLNVSVTVDGTAPNLTVPRDLYITQTSFTPDGVPDSETLITQFLNGWTATDNETAPGDIVVTNDAPNFFPIGQTVVSFTATDEAGNQSVEQASVFVIRKSSGNWWTEYAVLNGNPPDNLAPATQGQVAYMVDKANQAFLATVGNTPAINDRVNQTFDSNMLITLGQAKYMAQPFYDHLDNLGITPATAVSGSIYPWTNTTADDDNNAFLTLGQLKYIFSFEVLQDNDNAGTGDNLPDWWELRYFGSTAFGAQDDPDSDNASNLQERVQGTNPNF